MTASTHSDNPILEYHAKIESGEIVVCKKIRAVYDHLVDKIEHPERYDYHYDPAKAERVIQFVEKFTHPSKGRAASKPLQLALWQRAMISAIYGFVCNSDPNVREYKEAALIIARKNGKSTLASALALYHLFKDGEPGPEVFSVATKKDQARQIWDESCRMIHKSPALSKRARTLVGSIKVNYNDGEFKPLSSDSNRMDGLNISACFADEIHAWSLTSGQALWDVLRDGMSARTQPLMFSCSTAGFVRDGIYDAKYNEYKRIIQGYDDPDGYHDERTIAFCYELDDPKELWDEQMWVKANPGLDSIKSIDDLREKVAKAKADPARRRNLLTKDFDLPQSAIHSYFELEDLNTSTFDLQKLKPDYYIAGVDLSMTTDLTAACALFQVPGDDTIYVHSMAWMPEDTLSEHRKDGVPYETWYERGFLRLCRGNRINEDDVVQWFQELRDKYDMYLFRCGYDRYSSNHFVQAMTSQFGSGVLSPVAQGTKSLSVPMETSRVWLRSKKINYGNNPVLAWCLMNTQAKQDVNGGIQPCKNRDLNVRIDSYASMLDALAVYLSEQEAYQARIS